MLERRGRLEKEKHQGFFAGLYKRNEMFLIASAIIFLSSMFIGFSLSGVISSFMENVLKSFEESVSRGEISLNTLSIFINNIKIAFIIYAGGIVFGLVTAGYLIFNGLFIGYAASQYPIGDFIVFTLPHGIFEIAGIIIAGAAGFRLTSMIINIILGILKIKRYMPVQEQLNEIMDINYVEFKESLYLFAIAVILLLIAAFIEANFTIAWGNYIKGLI